MSQVLQSGSPLISSQYPVKKVITDQALLRPLIRFTLILIDPGAHWDCPVRLTDQGTASRPFKRRKSLNLDTDS